MVGWFGGGSNRRTCWLQRGRGPGVRVHQFQAKEPVNPFLRVGTEQIRLIGNRPPLAGL